MGGKDLQGMATAVYLRKSRVEDGQSLDEILRHHRDTLLGYASRSGMKVMEIYSEVQSGESLYTRPQMLRLLGDVEEKKYEAVLCMDIDRLSRGTMKDQGFIIETFKEAHTLIVTPDKIYDLSVEADEQFAELKTFISRQEYKLIRKRLERGKLAAAQEGCYLAIAPYGYKKVIISGKHTLEPYEPEAKFVRMMFEMYAAGAGCTLIAETLTNAGAKPRRTDRFKNVTILKMVRNPVYAGKIAWNKSRWDRKPDSLKVTSIPPEQWVTADGYHPALVSQELFDTCQSILKERYKPPTFDGTVKTPLAGLVRCRHCGRLMQRRPRCGVNYFICPTKGCTVASRYELVENAVLLHLEDILADLRIKADEGATDAEDGIRALELRRDAANAEIEKESQKKVKLYEFLEDGIYSRDEFAERMTSLKDHLHKLNLQVKALTSEINRVKGRSIADQTQQMKTVLDLYRKSDATQQNILLHSIVEKILYEKPTGAAPDGFNLDIFLR